MALEKKDLQLDNGLNVPRAYIKITRMVVDKQLIEANVKTYTSKEIADLDGTPVEQETVVFVPDISANSTNYHNQTYNHVKTKPKYTGAIDILEE